MTSHTDIKAVVFDFFGVICPDLAALTGAEFSQKHGLNPAEFSRFGHAHRAVLDSGTMSQLQFATELQEHWHLKTTPAELCQELDELDGRYYAFNHELHDLINQLKTNGITVALMSNSSRDESDYLRSLGAYDIFDQVFLSGYSGLTKRDPKWFREVAATLGFPASEILLIDDMTINVTTAQAAGWTESILYSTPSEVSKYLAQLGLSTR